MKRVISRVPQPQGTLLATVRLLVYINDRIQVVKRSYRNIFADDTKTLKDKCKRKIEKHRKWDWSPRWEAEFNLNRCNVMEVTKKQQQAI